MKGKEMWASFPVTSEIAKGMDIGHKCLVKMEKALNFVYL
jgi:hypothetical protein